MIRPSEDPQDPRVGSSVADGDEDPTAGYLVKLGEFEGPLDLLLYLIQRDEIDIYDIPIAHITHQYLEYLEVLDVFSLDNAGEFLVMAATLMRVKARMLLPVQRPEEDEEDGDPRDELVRRLLEYKKYKEAAAKLASAEESRADYFRRGTEFNFLGEDEEPPEFSLTMFDMLRAVKNVLDQIKGDNVHRVQAEVFTVERQQEIIHGLLADRDRIRFEEIFETAGSRMQVVVTFVAMLELLKQQRLTAYQLEPYGDIWLSSRQPEDEPPSKEAVDAA
jgi:segregation and condensation protein A